MMEAGKALTIDFFQLIPAACRVFVGKAIGKGNPAVFVRRVCILHIGGAVCTVNSGFEIVKHLFGVFAEAVFLVKEVEPFPHPRRVRGITRRRNPESNVIIQSI